MNELMEAIKKFEASTKWIESQDKETQEKHYPRFKKMVKETNDIYEKIIKELGYNPFENYDDLINQLGGLDG